MPLALVAVQKGPPPLGLAAMLPPVVPARIAPAERWTIARVAAPKPEPGNDASGSRTVLVNGRRVTIRPQEYLDRIDGTEVGRDGSVLIHRAHRGDIRWETGDAILFGGRETPVAEGRVEAFRDRRDYAASIVRDTMANGIPESAPEATLVRNGRAKGIGWGSVNRWGSDGTLVLAVPVDDAGRPCGYEFFAGVTTRLLTPDGRGGFREQVVLGYRMLGALHDGTVALVAGEGALAAGTIVGNVDAARGGPTRVLLWRGGRFLAHTELPKGWRAAGVSPGDARTGGWILARRAAPSVPEPDLLGQPMTRKEAEAAMDRTMRTMEDAGTAGERDWAAATLRGGTLTPIAFPRPKGTERLLWRDGGEIFGPAAFRFGAFTGDDERWFRVARR